MRKGEYILTLPSGEKKQLHFGFGVKRRFAESLGISVDDLREFLGRGVKAENIQQLIIHSLEYEAAQKKEPITIDEFEADRIMENLSDDERLSLLCAFGSAVLDCDQDELRKQIMERAKEEVEERGIQLKEELNGHALEKKSEKPAKVGGRFMRQPAKQD